MLFPKFHRRHKRILILFLIFGMTSVFFQNCQQGGFQVLDSANFSSVDPNSLIAWPVTPTGNILLGCTSDADCLAQESAAQAILDRTKQTINTNCFADSNVQACLFYKNPVISNGGVFGRPVNNTMDLSASQNFGVNLDPSSYVAGTGCLQNKTYIVNTNISVSTASTGGIVFNYEPACYPDFKVSYKNDTTFSVAAIMAHYYLNFQKSFMTDWAGHWYTTGHTVPVMSYIADSRFDNNAMFYGDSQSKTGAILMGGFKRNMSPAGAVQEAALSSEIYLHEAGHSEVFFASDPIPDPKLNVKCDSNGNTCCNSAAGCFGAINEGLADYHAIINFSHSPVVGESVVNNLDGIVEFGLVRNYAKLRTLMPAEAYAAPPGILSDGEVHVMGRIWGSIWYEARLDAQRKIGARGVRSIDKLFSRHLLALNGSDDFKSACKKVVAQAGTIDGGLVKNIFIAECARRGL